MVEYEWVVEVTTIEDSAEYEKGEIIDHFFSNTYSAALKEFNEPPIDGCKNVLVLVRDDDDDGRSWAYIKDGKLPEHFHCAYGRYQADVPKRFHKEVEKSNK